MSGKFNCSFLHLVMNDLLLIQITVILFQQLCLTLLCIFPLTILFVDCSSGPDWVRHSAIQYSSIALYFFTNYTEILLSGIQGHLFIYLYCSLGSVDIGGMASRQRYVGSSSDCTSY